MKKQIEKKKYYPTINVNTTSIEKFGIQDINNLTEVQKKIYNFYLNKYISTEEISKPITNLDTNMEIEIWKKGINETFGNHFYYKNLSNKQKKMKLATMDYLAKMIKYGKVRAKEKNNKHNLKSEAKYYYLEHPIMIDEIEFMVTIDIRKGPNYNGKFYIHSIKTKKIGASKSQIAPRLTAPISKINIPQTSSKVNSISITSNMQNKIKDTKELEILLEKELRDITGMGTYIYQYAF